ncbi:calcium-translocating P-type ATPase [Hyphopichia burtonii NRRL Y-1933]|uniref:Calcium-transporting ATPase n=1 Tax=Hyphopichia burtonii NRRL Y-1933 TaxID=984485 RepID=A0A1E4RID2_9ASCO|nr:calcium-translocating P-type ATPase [Hyphopichia burtonii NRRL Y-1933]ODV66986.1 calcium-translocating P-type ATPase [Hyphopichia burtonii NRRL Y-1933]
MAPRTTTERLSELRLKNLEVPHANNNGLSSDDDSTSINSNSPLTGDTFEFDISVDELSELHDPKSLQKLYELGDLKHVLKLLKTDGKNGITESSHDTHSRCKHFGANKLPSKDTKGFLRLCFDALKDKVLILLSVAAIISLALGLYETFGEGTTYDDEGEPMPKVDWVEGVAIIVAIIIIVLVGAVNDYQKERQFARLNAKKEDREIIVIRDGSQKMISIYDLLVGDIINLQTGDVIPSDCILINGELETDESALTGESDSIVKKPAKEALRFYKNQLPTDEDIGSSQIKFKDPFLISGAKILSGYGYAVITAVGSNSVHGRTMLSLHTEPETTPLQERLNNLAEGIVKYGFLAALVLFIVLFIRYCVNIAPGGKFNHFQGAQKGKKFLDIVIVAITIIVVAVPEGLPLAVTLALAFATTRMAQNGNLVRVLKSCETMGSATAVCSDKTGTLTENKMRIVKAYFGDDSLTFDDTVNGSGPKSITVIDRFTNSFKNILLDNIILNSTAFANNDYDASKTNITNNPSKKKSFFQKVLSNENSHNEIQQLGVVTEPYLGNKTDSALLILAQDKFGSFKKNSLDSLRDSNHDNIVQSIPFESSRKWSGIVFKLNDDSYRLYVKGAAEIIFKNCGFKTQNKDELTKLDRNDRDEALSKIDEFANDALRAIVLAHKDFNNIGSWPPAELSTEKSTKTDVNDENQTSKQVEADPDLLINLEGSKQELSLDAIVGLQDPLKEGVAEAVLQCKHAGVSVRMVTGDNLITAKAISKSCNILTSDDLSNEYACMEGPKFRKLSELERNRIAPTLRVLARSSPEDKRILVETLRKAGEVVAVTGDGTNDAPALKLADVGFSMGISGTEVAREASDIILMTDDFTDIVQAIKWGRTVATSIKKFIQFQLTVNITACVLTFVSAVASSNGQSVLTAVQLLWVNLIMDTLAALALATDKPDDSFLNRKPAGRTASLISVSMWKMIIGQSITQLIITFILHFAGRQLFFGNEPISNHENKQLDAMTFNAFVWLQIFKLVVTRKLDEADEISSVRGRITRENLDFSQHLFRNWYFIVILLIIVGVQVLIMFVGGAAFTIVRQTPGQWATAVLCGFISIPVGALIRIIPNEWVIKVFPTKAFNTFIYYAGFSFLRKKNRDLRQKNKDDASADADANKIDLESQSNQDNIKKTDIESPKKGEDPKERPDKKYYNTHERSDSSNSS